MSDQDSTIFENNQSTTNTSDAVTETVTTQDTSTQTDGTVDLLATITREDGSPKYTSVEDAIKSITPAQEHISKLEAEATALREELAKRQTAEDILEKIQAQETPVETPSTEVDPNAIQELVAQTVQSLDANKLKETNIRTVDTKMKEVFGEKAKEELAAKAEELGVGVAWFADLAATSPKAFLTQFGINTPSKAAASTNEGGTINTETFNQKPQEKPKSVMAGATSSQMLNSWRNAGNKS